MSETIFVENQIKPNQIDLATYNEIVDSILPVGLGGVDDVAQVFRDVDTSQVQDAPDLEEATLLQIKDILEAMKRLESGRRNSGDSATHELNSEDVEYINNLLSLLDNPINRELWSEVSQVVNMYTYNQMQRNKVGVTPHSLVKGNL